MFCAHVSPHLPVCTVYKIPKGGFLLIKAAVNSLLRNVPYFNTGSTIKVIVRRMSPAALMLIIGILAEQREAFFAPAVCLLIEKK